ncbi:hypothetical protein BH10PLA2_BH10PLA2_16460 [soil metagenome]
MAPLKLLQRQTSGPRSSFAWVYGPCLIGIILTNSSFAQTQDQFPLTKGQASASGHSPQTVGSDSVKNQSAFSESSPAGSLAVSQPVKADVPAQEKSRSELERELLLPLLLQERELLSHCGPDHPDLLAVQGRIGGVRDYLANLPPPTPLRATRETPAPASIDTSHREWTSAKPWPQLSDAQAMHPAPRRAQSDEIVQTSYPVVSKNGSSAIASGTQLSEPKVQTSNKSFSNPAHAAGSVKIDSKFDASRKRLDEGRNANEPLTEDEQPQAAVSRLDKKTDEIDRSATHSEPVITFGNSTPGSNSYFLKISGRQFALIVAGAIVCLLVQMTAFCLILRKFVERLANVYGSTIAKHSNGGDGSPTESTVSLATQEQPILSQGMYTERQPIDVSLAASLGPTWSEELQQKQDEEERRGQAIFQQLFKQNLELRSKLIVTAEAS